MSEEDFKKILEESLGTIRDDVRLVKGDLNLVKGDLKLVKENVKSVTRDLDNVKKDINLVKKDINLVKKDINTVKNIQQNQLLPSVITIESTIKTYGDMYKINNDNAKKLDGRLTTVENQLNLEPPPELSLTEVK